MLKRVFLIIFSFFCWAELFADSRGVLEVKVGDNWVEASSVNIINLKQIDTAIKVDLKYSGKDNFLKEDVYGNIEECFLQRVAAEKLHKAQLYLDSIKPGYHLVIYDALRPRSAQFRMWNLVKGTPMQTYVGNPQSGSIHNYGAAVDVSILDTTDIVLDMGTEFDFFGDLSQPRHEEKYLKDSSLTREQVQNRQLLRTVMIKAGYNSIPVEWWHFDAFPKNYIKTTFPIVEDLRCK